MRKKFHVLWIYYRNDDWLPPFVLGRKCHISKYLQLYFLTYYIITFIFIYLIKKTHNLYKLIATVLFFVSSYACSRPDWFLVLALLLPVWVPLNRKLLVPIGTLVAFKIHLISFNYYITALIWVFISASISALILHMKFLNWRTKVKNIAYRGFTIQMPNIQYMYVINIYIT